MVGALGPALKAGSPVTGSVTIFIRCGRFRRGVSTIRPSSIFASSGSPGRISSRRRSGPGRTTCPLVDTLVCMVRRSYLNETFFAIKLGLPGPYSLLPFPYLAFFRCACGTFGSVLVRFLSIIPSRMNSCLSNFGSLYKQDTYWVRFDRKSPAGAHQRSFNITSIYRITIYLEDSQRPLETNRNNIVARSRDTLNKQCF